MTYSQFLMVFVLPPFGVLLYVLRQKVSRPMWLTLIALIVIAVAYTTPWDNYLVASRVWYYDPRLVLNIILGYVPIEEYVFFIVQTLVVGLFAIWLWRRFYPQDWDRPARAPKKKK